MGSSKSKKKNNTLTPVWNHEITLDLTQTSPSEIEMKLMDWERFGKDEPMGRVLLPVELAVSKSSQDSFWVALDDCKSGQILISTQFSGSEETVTQSHVEKESPVTEIPLTIEEKVSDDKGGVKELKKLLQDSKTSSQTSEESDVTIPITINANLSEKITENIPKKQNESEKSEVERDTEVKQMIEEFLKEGSSDSII